MVEVHISITGVAIFAIIVIIFLICLLFYLYPVSNRVTTIPGPNVCDDCDGNINDIERSGSLHQYIFKLHDEYGNVVAFKYGQRLVVSVADPKHFAARTQLFDLPDFVFEHWRPLVGSESFLFARGIGVFKRRDLIEFTVSSSAKEAYAKTFRSLATELVKKWRGLPEGQHLPLSQHMKALATKAVCHMMFGDYFKEDAKVIKLHKAWDLVWNEVIATSKKEPTKSESDLQKAQKELRELMEDAVEHQWSKSSSSKDTLLRKLLSASNGQISGDEMISDVITLFTIGMQITWAVLTWSCYLIASDTEVQQTLRRKLNESESLDIMPENLKKMKYVRNLLKESVRYSEMFSFTAKQQDMETTVDQHFLPKQTPTLEAVGVAMKDEKLWEKPRQFLPSRFTSEKNIAFNPLDFIPFAFAGNRRNPSDSLVYLLASIAVASLFREFNLVIAGGDVTLDDANFDGLVVMPSKEEIWITVASGGKGKEAAVEDVGES